MTGLKVEAISVEPSEVSEVLFAFGHDVHVNPGAGMTFTVHKFFTTAHEAGEALRFVHNHLEKK